MAAEITVDSFLDLLQQSGLVSDAQMLILKSEFSGQDKVKPETPRVLADELVKRGILTEWQADMLAQGKHRGFRLGSYRILRPLGQGGMSKVFLAEHEMMHRRCAIKVLPSKYQEDPDLLRRFHVEARAIAALDHPHIVRAYDFAKDVKYGKEIPYLVMEYVEGQDLRRMIDEQGPMDYRKAADLIAQAAEGLSHAHEAGFVHRDIKPANLLVDPNGVLKILDLGLASATFEGEDAWQGTEGEQSAVGTADYVAPEQVMDSRGVDGRADIYSLGFTFYFLLTGKRPFPKSTLVELLMAHRVENPEPLGKLRPDVPLELVSIVEQMTAKNPALRFQTAKDVAERLRAWLHDSESGREYSRLSLLMAAAMRAKQASSEAGQNQPESSKTSESELSLIAEEDLSAPPPAPTAVAPTETRRPKASRSVSSDSKTKLKTAKATDSGKIAALPKAQADLLFDLLPNEAQAAPLPLRSSYKSQFKPPLKQSGGGNSVFQSPWLWIGLVGLILGAILIWAVLPGSSSDKPETPPVPRSSGNGALPVPPPAPPPPPPPPPEQKPPEQKPPEPKPPEPKPPEQKPQEPKPPEQKPPEQPPIKQPEPPPAKPSEPVEPKPESKPAPPPPAEVEPDLEALLAGVASMTFRLKSFDSDLNSPVNLTVQRQAVEAARKLRIEIVKNSPNVMEIELSASKSGESPGMFLSAELKCPASDDKNAKTITVWKHKGQVTSGSLERLPHNLVLKVLRTGANKFFEQYADDVRKARTKGNKTK